MKKHLYRLTAWTAVCCLLCAFAGCAGRPATGMSETVASKNSLPAAQAAQSVDLMQEISAAAVTPAEDLSPFIPVYMRWTTELLRAAAAETPRDNTLLSPLSVQLALAMTANGAAGDTKAEMERLLGGKLPLERLNVYLYTLLHRAHNEPDTGGSAKLSIANAIWFREDARRLTVEQKFLQTNAAYYGAAAYKAPFNDETCREINRWVNTHTGGLIPELIEQIEPDAVMFLINALAFDAVWEEPYLETAIRPGTFTGTGGARQVDMLFSEEYVYLNDGKATGFMKPYAGGRYSFAALLPSEGLTVDNYIAGLSAEGLLHTLQNGSEQLVAAQMPKFDCAYTLKMNDLLSRMGMPTAFDDGAADFSEIGRSANGKLFIGEVLHKTRLTVDGRGTRAGAATVVEIKDAGAAPVQPVLVTLDRPFVYMIVDRMTSLPVFIGVLRDIPAAT